MGLGGAKPLNIYSYSLILKLKAPINNQILFSTAYSSKSVQYGQYNFFFYILIIELIDL